MPCLPPSLVSRSFFPSNCYLMLFLSCSLTLLSETKCSISRWCEWDRCFSPRFLRRGPVGYMKRKKKEKSQALRKFSWLSLRAQRRIIRLELLASYTSTSTPRSDNQIVSSVSHKIQTAPAKNRLSECLTRERHTAATWTFSHQPQVYMKYSGRFYTFTVRRLRVQPHGSITDTHLTMWGNSKICLIILLKEQMMVTLQCIYTFKAFLSSNNGINLPEVIEQMDADPVWDQCAKQWLSVLYSSLHIFSLSVKYTFSLNRIIDNIIFKMSISSTKTDWFYAKTCNLKDRRILYALMTWSDNLFLSYACSAAIVLIAAYGKVIYKACQGYFNKKECGSYNEPRYDLHWRSGTEPLLTDR